MSRYVVAALYRFVRLDDFEMLRQPILDLMLDKQVRGTLLLASEGINGTIAGTRANVESVLDWLRSDPRFERIECKFSFDSEMPFYRSRVKLKKEIVTMGVAHIDPNQSVGTYVKPAQWNALISDPDVFVIDTRNDYESAIGTFKNAISAQTKSFRDFPQYASDSLNPQKHKKIAMFCTGGIRCEKSTAYLKGQGFDEVYHLQGGILKYLEQIPAEDSLWEGECFVFDNRVSVNHALEKGSYDQCHACRLPITEQDKLSARFSPGVSCPACYDEKSELQRRRFREREKQVQLAQQRGESHIGIRAKETAGYRKQRKQDFKTRQRNG